MLSLLLSGEEENRSSELSMFTIKEQRSRERDQHESRPGRESFSRAVLFSQLAA